MLRRKTNRLPEVPCLRRARQMLLRRGRQAAAPLLRPDLHRSRPRQVPEAGRGGGQTAKSRKRWWAATAVCAAAILYLSVIPISPGPDIPYLDKVVHLCQYWLFAWLLVQAIRTGRLKEREYLVLAWVYAASYGLLIEIIQGFLPWRSADWADVLANALGAAAGVWVGQWIPRKLTP